MDLYQYRIEICIFLPVVSLTIYVQGIQTQAKLASPSELVDILSSLLMPYSSLSDRDHRAAQYSPHYRLAFSLLNEDAAAGSAVLDWNIRGAIKSTLIFSRRPSNSYENSSAHPPYSPTSL